MKSLLSTSDGPSCSDRAAPKPRKGHAPGVVRPHGRPDSRHGLGLVSAGEARARASRERYRWHAMTETEERRKARRYRAHFAVSVDSGDRLGRVGVSQDISTF